MVLPREVGIHRGALGARCSLVAAVPAGRVLQPTQPTSTCPTAMVATLQLTKATSNSLPQLDVLNASKAGTSAAVALALISLLLSAASSVSERSRDRGQTLGAGAEAAAGSAPSPGCAGVGLPAVVFSFLVKLKFTAAGAKAECIFH